MRPEAVNDVAAAQPTPRERQLQERLEEASARIAALEARLDRIEGRVGGSRARRSGSPGPNDARVGDAETSRRDMLKGAGLLASITVGHVALSAEPAAAADQTLLVGVSNTGTADTKLTKTTVGGAAFIGENSSASGLADGLRGVADSSAGAGVFGSSRDGYGVYGSTTNGYSIYASGRFGLGQHSSVPGPPTDGTYDLGDLVRDSAGNIWACVTAGSASAGVAQFRKVAGASASGQLHLLAAPLRAYDSRPGEVQFAASGGDGAITAGSDRVVSLALGRSGTNPVQTAVPQGSSGALVNLTITDTVGGGYATLYSNAVPFPGTSTTNWINNGMTIASTTTTAVDSLSRVKLRCAGQATQFIIDVIGYYR
jgi:hypothetical protein